MKILLIPVPVRSKRERGIKLKSHRPPTTPHHPQLLSMKEDSLGLFRMTPSTCSTQKNPGGQQEGEGGGCPPCSRRTLKKKIFK